MSKRKKILNFLFVADPLSKFDHQRESTLWIMHEAAKRGHRIYATLPGLLSTRNRNVYAPAEEIKVLSPGQKNWYRNLGTQRKDIRSFDAVLLRKDPPFDQRYLDHLYLLDLVSDEVYMMNHPRGIIVANEKLFPLSCSKNIPDTLVSGEYQELKRFVEQHPRGTVIKPLHSSGGHGVFLIRNRKSDNLKVILETATEDFSRHVIAQAYAPVHQKGDRRVMVLGQEILGCFVRKPASGEHRANLHSGGSAHPSKITRQDQTLIASLKPALKALGLDFVGLDIIGDFLIEANVTSPMGLYELNHTGSKASEAKVVDFLESRVK